MHQVCTYDVVPVVLAALVEDVVDALPLKQPVRVVYVLVCQVSAGRVARDIAYDVENGDAWMLRERLARQWLLVTFDVDRNRCGDDGEQGAHRQFHRLLELRLIALLANEGVSSYPAR